jgi:16S rRNA (cytidine1402-2'-O)-methyltransferase
MEERMAAEGSGGVLYVVATPIGNLEDLSPRALRILNEADLIAAEDTRVTRRLLSHFGVHTPLTSYHAHTGERKAAALVERLRGGERIALVSDAGTPGISDPGGMLVRAAIEAGIVVSPVPGPNAVAAAVSASGLDPSRFLFEGFLPRKKGDQRRVLEALRRLPHTLAFYEAPGRVAATLGALREVLGERRAVVAREITKKFEEFARGQLSELEVRFREQEPRGECVILVAGAGDEPDEPAADPDALVAALLAEGKSARDTAREAAERYGIPRKEAYARALRLSGR